MDNGRCINCEFFNGKECVVISSDYNYSDFGPHPMERKKINKIVEATCNSENIGGELSIFQPDKFGCIYFQASGGPKRKEP